MRYSEPNTNEQDSDTRNFRLVERAQLYIVQQAHTLWEVIKQFSDEITSLSIFTVILAAALNPSHEHYSKNRAHLYINS